ncbi:hypothetical protein HBE96_14975 [Clostridium sp. P21]|uniref:Uncharacterized protein n=1 Tax=Clostridium muellerianum TaxID=2716538 RepID=A0A7Y0EI83_9CLOT|nr:hypothetical protein [Clostridium muellerianum]NMM63954.1 hypothetical protein [Clostridium muellerianum]
MNIDFFIKLAKKVPGIISSIIPLTILLFIFNAIKIPILEPFHGLIFFISPLLGIAGWFLCRLAAKKWENSFFKVGSIINLIMVVVNVFIIICAGIIFL